MPHLRFSNVSSFWPQKSYFRSFIQIFHWDIPTLIITKPPTPTGFPKENQNVCKDFGMVHDTTVLVTDQLLVYKLWRYSYRNTVNAQGSHLLWDGVLVRLSPDIMDMAGHSYGAESPRGE